MDGGILVVHPRRRDSVDVGRADTVPLTGEERFPRMVEPALARDYPRRAWVPRLVSRSHPGLTTASSLPP